jgi:hypothetical protein
MEAAKRQYGSEWQKYAASATYPGTSRHCSDLESVDWAYAGGASPATALEQLAIEYANLGAHRVATAVPGVPPHPRLTAAKRSPASPARPVALRKVAGSTPAWRT